MNVRKTKAALRNKERALQHGDPSVLLKKMYKATDDIFRATSKVNRLLLEISETLAVIDSITKEDRAMALLVGTDLTAADKDLTEVRTKYAALQKKRDTLVDMGYTAHVKAKIAECQKTV